MSLGGCGLGGGKVPRGFAVALGHSEHFQKEELEMAQHWQRRAGILSKGMPETESRSFVLLVTLVVLPTSRPSAVSGMW